MTPGFPFEKDLQDIFSLSGGAFEETALKVFHFQLEHNSLYRSFCKSLHAEAQEIKKTEDIPFLPIGFFKTHEVKTTAFKEALVFESSGTTGSVPSRHYIKDAGLYEQSFEKAFELFYGSPRSFCILALLPSYLERSHSSLVYMAEALIKKSGHPASGFYLRDHEKLRQTILENETRETPTLLLGVTYALLDFFEQYPMTLQHTLVMETGGMKGRREELLREEVHGLLKRNTGLDAIHSEYGMTELLSQAYSRKDGIFHCPPWMKVLVRHEDDPLDVKNTGSGAVNIIDLANIFSCSFIATDDAGKIYADGSFEVTGRLDNTDMRGCSLMAAINKQ